MTTDLERLRRENQALRRTVDALMDAQEQRAQAVEESAFSVFRRNADLESLIATKTASLARNRSFLAAILDALDTELCILGSDGEVVEANRAWRETWGEARGTDLGSEGRRRWGFESARQVTDGIARVLAGQTDQFLGEVTEGCGKRRTLRVAVTPIPETDEGAAVLAFTDVSERVRALEQLIGEKIRVESLAAEVERERTLLGTVISNLPHAVYWKDGAGRYRGYNGSFLRMVGQSPQTRLEGLRDAELGWSDDTWVARSAADAEAGESSQPLLAHEETWRSVDGARLSVLTSRVPIARAGEPDDWLLGIGVDVTALKELQAQLSMTNRLTAIGQLAAGVAHEINTPTQYVKHNTVFLKETMVSFEGIIERLREAALAAGVAPEAVEQLLQDEEYAFLTEEVGEAIEQSIEGLDQVARIVRALREFSHPTQAPVAANLIQVVEHTVQVAKSEWRYVADLQVQPCEGVDEVMCVPGEVGQAILNLIVNAAHAIGDRQEEDPARGRIVVRLERDGDEVSIHVEDDGCGIPEENLPRVFDPFFTTKELGRGTGQGLSVVHRIARKHEGHVLVRGRPEGGTAFTLVLPLAPSRPPLVGREGVPWQI